MHLILSRCYFGLLSVFMIVLTLLIWPLILLVQQFSVTREYYYTLSFGIINKLGAGVFLTPKVKLFASMEQHLKKLQENGNTMKVLEIGPGIGDNFKYYQTPIKLTTIDLNSVLDKYAKKLSDQYPLVDIVASYLANAENMTCFEDDTFDVVCGTNIMCCIEDNSAALNEIHRVLKPNGRFYFLEGNRMQKNRSKVARTFEMLFAKIWITCEYGCKLLNNNFDEKLHSSKMTTDWCQIYRIRESLLGHEVHYGCAMKV